MVKLLSSKGTTDVIIMDIVMPHMTGIELDTRHLKEWSDAIDLRYLDNENLSVLDAEPKAIYFSPRGNFGRRKVGRESWRLRQRSAKK